MKQSASTHVGNVSYITNLFHSSSSCCSKLENTHLHTTLSRVATCIFFHLYSVCCPVLSIKSHHGCPSHHAVCLVMQSPFLFSIPARSSPLYSTVVAQLYLTAISIPSCIQHLLFHRHLDVKASTMSLILIQIIIIIIIHRTIFIVLSSTVQSHMRESTFGPTSASQSVPGGRQLVGQAANLTFVSACRLL